LASRRDEDWVKLGPLIHISKYTVMRSITISRSRTLNESASSERFVGSWVGEIVTEQVLLWGVSLSTL
jgi:hypothetical protein